MDDLSSKISGILSDPQAMEQIKGLGEMLGLSNNDAQLPLHKEEKKDKDENVIQGIFGDSSPDMLNAFSKLLPMMSSLKKEDDTTRLLSALRPFLSETRRKKLDEASKLIRIMKLLPMIKDVGILDSLF